MRWEAVFYCIRNFDATMTLTAIASRVWVLALIQSLAMTSGTLMVLVAGLFGAKAAADPSMATLPLALMIVGTATFVTPLTLSMRKFGRKPILYFAVLLGLGSSALAAYAVSSMSFVVFCIAAIMLGMAAAGFQQIRFAAIESVDEKYAPKVLSMILLGGLVAAILGPELAMLGQNISDVEFVGAFYLLGGLMLICGILLSFYQPAQASDTQSQDAANKRPIKTIMLQPVFILAVAAASLGYAIMAFVMTATPLHMHVFEHHNLADTKLVIQSHIVAMFAPSFFSGILMSKIGERAFIMLGIACFALVLGGAYIADSWWAFWLSLVLLGIGWNFLFTAGTSLLPKAYTEGEKFKVQAVNEGMVFGMQALASLSAGAVLYALGWQNMILACVPIVVLLFLLTLWFKPAPKSGL